MARSNIAYWEHAFLDKMEHEKHNYVQADCNLESENSEKNLYSVYDRDTAGLNILCGRTKKSICRGTERAMSNWKLHTKNFRQGASTDAGNNIISSFFGELFLEK